MATFPYAQPIGALGQIITKLRSSFPEKVDAAVLKKLGIASNNESYIINTIRFLGITDKEGARTQPAHDLFVLGEEEFTAGFATMVKTAYKSLFDLHADASWDLDKSKLISFFRTEDKSTELVGTRQADTFIRLAELAGKRQATVGSGNGDAPKKGAPKRDKNPAAKLKADKSGDTTGGHQTGKGDDGDGSSVSLAVKIEVNLPATADQGVYDAIFRSIRANLIDRD